MLYVFKLSFYHRQISLTSNSLTILLQLYTYFTIVTYVNYCRIILFIANLEI